MEIDELREQFRKDHSQAVVNRVNLDIICRLTNYYNALYLLADSGILKSTPYFYWMKPIYQGESVKSFSPGMNVGQIIGMPCIKENDVIVMAVHVAVQTEFSWRLYQGFEPIKSILFNKQTGEIYPIDTKLEQASIGFFSCIVKKKESNLCPIYSDMELLEMETGGVN